MELTHGQQDTQCAYKVTQRRLSITIVAVTKNEVLDFIRDFFFSQCHHMSFCGLRGPPSWAWQKCNRLLRLGRP